LGHYLQTENSTAADQIGHEHDPLPPIGTVVHYHPRPTDVKRGRTVMPAMVLWQNQDRTLELLIIADANDQINQERVPESPSEHERGWSRIPSQTAQAGQDGGAVAALRADLETLREQVLGGYVPDEALPVVDAIFEIRDRLTALEEKPAPRPRGRPKKAKAKPVPSVAA
jgi:hypothetical protein